MSYYVEFRMRDGKFTKLAEGYGRLDLAKSAARRAAGVITRTFRVRQDDDPQRFYEATFDPDARTVWREHLTLPESTQ